MNNQMVMDLFVQRKTLYANTPFEVDEYDDSDAELDCSFSRPRSECSQLTLGSLNTLLSNQSYLILDFEDGELSPCNTEHGYGITHPDEQAISSLDGPYEVYDSESIWYGDEEGYTSDFHDDGSVSVGKVPSMTMSHTSSGEEDTDGFRTPTSASEDIEDSAEEDQAAISELRASLTRHLPPSANGSAYFEVLVAEALSSLDQALREAPVNCFEQMCWESHTQTPSPLMGTYDNRHSGSHHRRKSKQYIPDKQLIDVPEEVQAPFEWVWKEAEAYKNSILSSSQNIGFSPQAVVKKSQQSPSSFKRFARHFKFARETSAN